MSMSSLSAQLASLNSSAEGGKNFGSSLSSSKRQGDTVGRGVSHSVKHGHSVQPVSARHKPSVLYADSKAASDVPLTTLRENCVSSLRQLAKLTLNTSFVAPQLLQTLAGVHSLNFERGLATRSENEKMDAIITELLSLLSTAMGESASTSTTSCFSSSMHVLEYLLRRYDIHARPNTAESLIVAVLPHHEQPVVSRVLQLIDLASLPTWAFLRPFASMGSPPPSRTALAKRAARDNTLLRYCCDMAKAASMIHESECEGQLFQAPRRGVSRVISFAAAVIVEALNIQSTNPANNGSVAEPTLRCLLPDVLNACGDKKKAGFSLGMICADWRGFGHVLASLITEKCVLAPDARELLATTVAKGAKESERAFGTVEAMEDPDAQQCFAMVADSLVVLMTVLSQKAKGETTAGLITIPSKRHSKRHLDADCLGYALHVGTYLVLVKLKCLSTALGHLHHDCDLIVAPFVASLVSVAISRLSAESKGSSYRLLMDLIRQTQLKSLWKDPDVNLSGATAATLLSCLVSMSEEKCTTTLLEDSKSVIDALRTVSATGCDAGIAHAVTSIGKKSKESRVTRRLCSVLGLQVESDEMDSALPNESTLLPPRVALEHADKCTRMHAIERLMEAPPTGESGSETLEEALLRHFLIEEKLDIVIASGSGLFRLLRSGAYRVSVAFCESCLDALRKWSLDENDFLPKMPNLEKATKERKQKDSETPKDAVTTLLGDRVRALVLALEIAGCAVGSLLAADDHIATDDFDFARIRLIQGIIAHLDFLSITERESKENQQYQIGSGAFQALSFAMCHPEGAKSTVENARRILLTSEMLIDGLRGCWSEQDVARKNPYDISDSLVLRYFIFYLTALTNELVDSAENVKESTETTRRRVSEAVKTCLFIVKHTRASENESILFSTRHNEDLVRCLGRCATQVQVMETGLLLNTVVELSSTPSQYLYDGVCLPSIDTLCDAYAALEGVPKLAILMEVALRPAVADAAKIRLLSLVTKTVSSEQRARPVEDIIVSVLALMEHPDQEIRKSALRLLAAMKEKIIGLLSGMQADDAGVLSTFICQFGTDTSDLSSLGSSVVMGEASTLLAYIGATVLRSTNTGELRKELLGQCHRTALSLHASRSKGSGEKRWLSFQEGEGGCNAASLILKSFELSGERAFPLADRYKYAGKFIVNAMLDRSTGSRRTDGASSSVVNLVHSVARMLKGVTVTDASSIQGDVSNIIISTGPSARGTRARSYSVGRSVGVSFVEPYPKEMYESILECLSLGDEEQLDDNVMKKKLCSAVLHEVLQSQSWSDRVFKKLGSASRRQVTLALLNLYKKAAVDGVTEAFLALPLDGTDITGLIQGEGIEKADIEMLVYLSDYVHAHSKRLRENPRCSELLSVIFKNLEVLSSTASNTNIDEVEFARQRLLGTIASLLSHEAAPRRKILLKKVDIAKHAALVVDLVDGDAARRPLPSGRARSLAFSVLASLCSEDPPSVVRSVVSAILANTTVHPCPGAPPGLLQQEHRAPRETFLSLAPVFLMHSKAAGLTFFDLFIPFFDLCDQGDDDRTYNMTLCSCMMDALLVNTPEPAGSMAPVSSFIVALLAFDVHNQGRKTEAATVATQILLCAAPVAQVTTTIELLEYTNGFLLKVAESSESVGCIAELEKAILRSTKRTNRTKDGPNLDTINIAVNILQVVLNILESQSVMNLIRRGDTEESKLSLRLWQDLLALQSATSIQCRSLRLEEPRSHSALRDLNTETDLWGECESLIDTSLEQLHSLLPTHLFLASVASIIHDKSDMDASARAIQFVSEKAAAVDVDTPEASLFLDLLPMLVELLDSFAKSFDRDTSEWTMLVQQSVLVTAENLARTLCLRSINNNSGRLAAFTSVLEHASLIIKAQSASFEQQEEVIHRVEGPSCHLLCSAALSASTLVRLLGARSIPFLPNLVGPLLSVLSSVNEPLSQSLVQWNALRKSQAAALQLSIFRMLIAVADSIPQFLGPYLERLLSSSALLSSLRSQSGDDPLNIGVVATQLGSVLSQKIAARQLIPSLCKSLMRCERRGEVQALLAMLKESIEQAPRSELPELRSWLLKALTFSYEFQGDESNDKGIVGLVDEANEVLVVLVMKFSEAQLRPLYGKLHDWKGEGGSETVNAPPKKYAFWSLSAVLSMELRSIFLPCLSTVVSDAVSELDFAVAQMCGTAVSKALHRGKKRRRLEPSEATGAESMTFLGPLLQCLESALHADASDGGKWVRSDDNQRFHSLLAPLSKLLELRVSSNVGSEANAYRQLVHGTEEGRSEGTVTGCLTALAAAAGHEQLWKPLNHAVLEACGNESRAEVRKGGVACLLSLIKALGEEYMVLLPECLPVLSELLEDSDEEIAGLAQECVSFGEELLGESLQDSLR